MELTCVIEALREFADDANFRIYSDSLYVINCAKGLWKRKANVELWREYDKVSKGKKIEFIGDHYNELVDKLAKSVSEKNS